MTDAAQTDEERLAALKLRRDDMISGRSLQEVTEDSGASARYFKGDLGALNDEIRQLEMKLSETITQPVRGFARVRF